MHCTKARADRAMWLRLVQGCMIRHSLAQSSPLIRLLHALPRTATGAHAPTLVQAAMLLLSRAPPSTPQMQAKVPLWDGPSALEGEEACELGAVPCGKGGKSARLRAMLKVCATGPLRLPLCSAMTVSYLLPLLASSCCRPSSDDCAATSPTRQSYGANKRSPHRRAHLQRVC